MINAINIPKQEIKQNQDILFDTNRIKTNCSIKHNEGSGLFKIRKDGLYNVFFQGNIQATPEEKMIEVAIAVDGEANYSSLAKDNTLDVETYHSIALALPVKVCGGCCVDISVKNLTNGAISVENANIIIERIG